MMMMVMRMVMAGVVSSAGVVVSEGTGFVSLIINI